MLTGSQSRRRNRKNGKLLSTGHRGEAKGMHAGRIAIQKLGREELEGSTLYTTLRDRASNFTAIGLWSPAQI